MGTNTMQAVVITPGATGNLGVAEIAAPTQDSDATLVRTRAVSLNRGEVKRAQVMEAGNQIGWDLAGIVERAAPDGSGPPTGARVVGFSPAMQGWAELVAVKSRQLAIIPDDVSFEDAATLPVAGLTALYGLERCNRLLSAKVVLTGARGGVGFFACQLAVTMGARVFAQVRASEHAAMFEGIALEQVVADAQGDDLAALGPFRLVLDGVGGPMLGRLVRCLESDGRAVAYGVSDTDKTEVGVRDLMFTGSGRLEGFHLYRESEIVSAGNGLARLMHLMSQGKLRTLVSRVDDWNEVGTVANALIERTYPGKAVLTLP